MNQNVMMNQSFQNPYMRYNQPEPQQNNGINWVQGIEGAKAFQLPANSNLVLMDSENDGIFYIKVSDNIGMSNLRIFRYEEITDNPKVDSTPAIDLSDYVTRQELQEALESIRDRGGKANGKQSIQSTKSKPTINE